ncbi:accessory Sec system glycosylation chaperone GtfB [Roseburia hominis]
MERLAKQNNVVLLFDNFSTDSQALLDSFQIAGYECPAVVIEDDGFLPDGVMSVYGSFLGDFKGDGARPKYFNQVKIPDYWQIRGTNNSGEIRDLNRLRGRIFYAEPLHKRLVKVVDWYDERGVVRSSDHYNRYGAVWARTTFNAKGHKVNKSYFSAAGQEVIVENFVTGDIILNEGDEVKFFRTKTDFAAYFLKKKGLDQRRIFFNSLSTPFFVSNALMASKKSDVLFWQEPIRDEIPGNMRIILKGEAPRAGKILVQKRRSYERLIELGADPGIVGKQGFLYPFKRKNRHRAEALICTNSDQIEKCREIVEALPQMHFSIAALTEMSSKLLAMGNYDNVTLYPGVKMKILDRLFEKCDWYLDINYGTEIVSAVRRAFLNNQLIYAFDKTVHNADYVAGESIYAPENAGHMIEDMKKVLSDTDLMDEYVKRQQEAAMSECVKAYEEILC